MKITFNKSNPPLGGLLVAEYVAQRNKMPLEIKWCNESSVANIVCNTSNDVCRTIVKLYCPELTGSTASELTEIDHWLTFSIGPLSSTGGFSNALNYLNNILKPLTFLTAKRITIADFCVFAALHVNDKWNEAVSKNTALPNVLRWYNYIGSFNDVSKILSSLPEEVKTVIRSQSSGGISDKTTAGKVREGGKFVDLPGAEMGKVVVRFPPEASGYLHIGHAKAALLNQYYQEAFEGKLIMRFDDTNPAKENLHFEKVILEDVEMLQIKPDMFTHTSQYFDLMLDYCIQLLKEGKAYVDDTEAELMKQQREQKIESPNRSNSLEKNMMLWDEMLKGTEKGQQCCVRAKIDMQSLNGCMRDPTIYRCKNEPHPRTGDKYKVYPTYDFACPIVDAIEGVTHTLRTMEYHDRDPQFYWFIDALGLRKPYIWEYSRLSMTNTVLSKRKLTWFVNEKLVDGWDDPRMPTVRGVLRRGMTVEGLKEFIIAQGSSRSVVFMEWDKIWAINKKIIDPIAPRYTAVSLSQHVKVFVRNANEECLIVPKHPKNSDVGNKEVWIGQNILIDRVDAECLKEGENATFINWGNLLIKKINRNAEGIINIEAETNLDNKDFKKTLKLTWLPETKKAPFTDCWCVYFDHIISKPLLGKDEDFKAYIGHPTKKEVQMIGDPELKKLKKGDIIQLQRRGFFKVDIAWEPINLSVSRERPIVLFHIPDGHTKENPIKDLIETPKNNETDNQTIKMYTIQKHNYTGTDVIIDKSGVKVVEKIVPKSAFHSIAKHLSSDTTFTDLETNKIEKLNDAIIKQGELIRKLKAEKIDRSKIDPAVKILLNLKADYKKITNKEWAPGVLTQSHVEKQPETQESKIRTPGELNDEIIKQGDIVRNLKMQKTNKNEIDAAVKSLLTLKEDYKKVTNTEWKSGCEVSSVQSSSNKSGSELNAEINKQGDIVRNLKAQKAVKSAIDVAVKKLLDLKADYKKVTNTDWKPGCTPPTPISNVDNSKSQSAFNLNAEIIKQGDFVRNLKTEKAGKSEIDAAVKVLLNLKADYKNITKTEWKPGCTPPTPLNNTATTLDNPPTTESASNLNAEIVKQGDTVRDLKAQKAAKSEIDAAVKILLNLKADYKKITNTEWKPGCTPAIQLNNKSDNSNNNEPVNNLNAEIIKQGDVVRSLKSQKVPKSEIDAAVKILLNLKSEYKKLTNTDWKPGCTPPTPATNIDAKSNSLTTKSAGNLNAEILKQGDIVRNLKGQKASKSDIDAAVKILLNLKADYKKVTNIDWKPGCIPPTDNVEIMKQEELRQITPGKKTASDINTEIIKQGDLVRNLKAQKAPKSEIDAAVKTLLLLKSDYKSETNIDWKPGCIPPSDEPKVKEKTPSDTPKGKAVKQKSISKEKITSEVPQAEGGVKKVTRLGLEAKKEENLADWYSQVITKGELIEYYDVSGCYIFRPWSFAIWEKIRDWFDSEIKKLGVQNCYFPIFVSKSVLEKEKTHIADFAPEVAWVTKSGNSDMAEPIAVRPTSETVMYPAYAKWIQSYRDLPIKLNQWNNVVRWEFKHPQPFLRTREFLWQEGHTAYAQKDEACEEVAYILDLYAKVYTDLLAIPVVKGRKTVKEQFAGGDYTLTVEAFVSASGRAIQGATSHHLGQNFSKMFDIIYEDPDTQEKKFVYQNSWGMTTRTIGVMIMVHADNKGLVLPPRIAAIQVVIVPCGITAGLAQERKDELEKSCEQLEKSLEKAGVRVKGDYRSIYSPGWKFNHWELKGVPIRVELGPKDIENKQIVAVRRDSGEKIVLPRVTAVEKLKDLLEKIHENMYIKALHDLNSHKVLLRDWSEFASNLDKKNIILAPFCGDSSCEDKIKSDSARNEDAEPGAPSMGAKSLCIPLEQPSEIKPSDKCIHPECKNQPQFYTLFGRSY